MEKEDFFALETRAKESFQKVRDERVELWLAVVDESNLGEGLKKQLREILKEPFRVEVYNNVTRYLDTIATKIHQACPEKDPEARAVYNSIGSDVEALKRELYEGI